MSYKLKIFLAIAFFSVGSFGVVQAAPYFVQQRTIIPETDNLYDLGTSTKEWRNLYMQGDLINSSISDGCGTWASGVLGSTGSACGAGGGGSGGGTWGTTTSQVSGRLINYSLLNTDIVAIGANATTSAEFWFDPNVLLAKFLANFWVTGSSTLNTLTFNQATGTQATTTNLNTTNLKVATLTGPLQALSGVVSASSTLSVAYGGTGSTTLSGLLKGNGVGMVQTAVLGTDYLATVVASTPLSGSGTAGSPLVIANAAADGSTKGAASFTTADFNSSSGNISIDYTNGQAASRSAKGFLTSTDFGKFDDKVSSSSLSGASVISYTADTGVITTTPGTFAAGDYVFPGVLESFSYDYNGGNNLIDSLGNMYLFTGAQVFSAAGDATFPGNVLLGALAGNGIRCLNVDNSGNVTLAADECNTGGSGGSWATTSDNYNYNTQLKDWNLISSTLRPTTTVGIIVSASSTIGNGTQVGGLTIFGGATTTGNLRVKGAQFSNDIGSTTGATTQNIDWNTGNTVRVLLTGSTNIVINATSSNPKDGGKYILKACQDATGSRAMTFITPEALRWPTLGATPGATTTISSAANSCSFIGFIYDATYGVYSAMGSTTGVRIQ